MPLRLEVKKLLKSQSDRVKAVDLHPTEPWVLSAIYSGKLTIHDYNNQSILKTIEACQVPVRCAAFIARKHWIVCGCDDINIRVYNYNTLEKVKVFEAHADYIRSVAVHPTNSYVLSSSDDVLIKLWDWDLDWTCIKTFESHSHYVMMVKWNPRDLHIFASASLDKTIRVWGTQNTGLTGSVVRTPHFTLYGHKDGVNCIDYSHSGERPYLISGSDDYTVRVWDYQTKQCIQTLSGHTKNVSSVLFHPQLPVILSGSEDGTIRIWHSATFRAEKTLDFTMDRAWCIACKRGLNLFAIAFDGGTLVVKLGNDTPVASLYGSKIIWTKGSDIVAANLKLVDDTVYDDGEILDLSVKVLGNSEMFPQSISHHPSGRFIVLCDDNEYIIYTAQALRSKSFGPALNFVWGPDGNYATRSHNGRITVFHNFQEHSNFTPPFTVEELFGGQLIGLKTAEFIYFYDWQSFRFIRGFDVSPSFVWWAENGNFVTLACEDNFYVLSHDKDVVLAAVAGNASEDDDGIEIAFELVAEINDKINSGLWIAECFVYISCNLRIFTFVAGKVEKLAVLEHPLFILGYNPEHNRLYLIDRDYNICTYQLHEAVVEYQSCIARKDFEAADKCFARIPSFLYNKVANFLEHQGFLSKALEVAKDPDKCFDLALRLEHLEECCTIIRANTHASTATKSAHWKQLGDKALERGKFRLAEECFEAANDFNALFLLYTAVGDAEKLQKIAIQAEAANKTNVAFQSFLLVHDLASCCRVLMNAKRLPEAALFALTYIPSKVEEILKQWQAILRTTRATKAQTLLFPAENNEEFPDLDVAMQLETLLKEHVSRGLPSTSCNYEPQLMVSLITKLKDEGVDEIRRFLLSHFEPLPSLPKVDKTSSISLASSDNKILTETEEDSAVTANLDEKFVYLQNGEPLKMDDLTDDKHFFDVKDLPENYSALDT